MITSTLKRDILAIFCAVALVSSITFAEDSNITNTTTTTSTVTSNNTNTNNNTNVNQSTSTNTNTNFNTNNTTISQTNNSTSNNTNVNTSTVTSTINQTQNVNNTSLITNNSTTENTNLNTNNSTSVSTNTNNNTSQNVNTNNSTSQSSQKVTQRVKSPPPSAVAPSIMSYSQDLCTSGASSAVQTQFFGISTGRSVRDENCERLKLSKGLYDMGMRVAAVALLCEDARVWRSMAQAGTPCPYKGKIGEEARIAWEENPQDRPDWDEVKKELTGYEIKAYKKGDFCKRYPNHKICKK